MVSPLRAVGWLGESLAYSAGMSRIMTCALGVAKLLRGGTWQDTGLPDCFQPTSERLIENEPGVRAGWTGPSI